jgi:hypothetical protein
MRTYTGDFDAETLRQELVAALGATGWYLNGSQGSITFVSVDNALDDLAEPVIRTHMGNVLGRAKASVWVKIKALRDLRQSGGYLVAVATLPKWFHSDDGSRIQQLGLLMLGASIPANLQWKTMDGTFVTMTQALASQIFSAASASDQAIFAKAEAHKTAMLAATDPAAYDFSTGWPAVFTG